MKGLDTISPPEAPDRRRDVRLGVPADLRLELGDPEMRARVVDISETGALVNSNLPFVLGPAYRAIFRLGSHVTECQAIAAHCRPLDNGRWLVGLRLTSDRSKWPLADLIDLITKRSLKFS